MSLIYKKLTGGIKTIKHCKQYTNNEFQAALVSRHIV